MFSDIFGFYIQGLVLAIIFVFIIGSFWLYLRARKKIDRTAKERQSFLYDILLMGLMTAPILSYAFMAVILMFKS
jgi:hypothetical protein